MAAVVKRESVQGAGGGWAMAVIGGGARSCCAGSWAPAGWSMARISAHWLARAEASAWGWYVLAVCEMYLAACARRSIPWCSAIAATVRAAVVTVAA